MFLWQVLLDACHHLTCSAVA